MNAKLKTIVWDWNGTLVDDVTPCISIINELLERRGKEKTTVEKYRSYFTFPVKKYYGQIGFDLKKEDFAQLSDEFMDLYFEKSLRFSLRHEIVKVVEKAHKLNYKQHILSAMEDSSLKRMVERYNIDSFFNSINGTNNNEAQGKEDIAIGLYQKIQKDSGPIYFVGDTTHDYNVSKIFKAQCILISGGHQSNERLLKCTDAFFASGANDLFGYLI